MRPGKGVRVVRGPDWCFGGQDGGPGHLGTIVDLSYEITTCTVRWDVGTVTKDCRANDQEQDLRIVDNSHPDLEHNVHAGIHCDGEHCKKSAFSGFRWKCVECSDFDLCTKCYMAGVHDRTHHFTRFDTVISVLVPVPPRKTSKWIKTYSMEPGAQVKHTKHRKSATADGKVLKVTQGTSFASTVQVEWASGETTLHEICQEKKSDLVIAHSTGHIYPDHLPLADLSERVNTYLNTGDRVVVDMNVDTFRQIQKEYGGWDDQMEKLLGEIGVVEQLVLSRAHVCYKTLGRKWIVCVNACSKVSLIDLGDLVKLLEDEGLVKKRQHRHGGWQDTMKKELGEIGQVIDIDSSGDLFVKFKTHTHLLNPSCCVKVCDGERHLEKKTRSEVRTEIRSDIETEMKVTEMEDEEVEAELQPQETDLTELETDAAYSESVASTLDSGISDSIGLCYDFSDMEFDDMVADIGLRVVRGKDWKWDNQDGGDGNLGTIVMVGNSEGSGSCPQKCAVVLWDSGYRNTYRAGYQDAYDLKIYDTAPVGVRHVDVQCSECEETDLMGFIWQCTTCDSVTLCHSCYHSDVHNLSHNFLRIDKPGDEGKSVPKRERSRKVRTRGAFEGTKVIRGPDWRWDNQDSNSEGEVIAVVNFSLDTDRDAVEVRWKDGTTNVYRYGFDGSFDVKCLTPVEYGMYFKDHLPDFKIVDGTPAETAVDTGAQPSDRFNPGDTVRIGVDPDVLQAIHKSGGNWSDGMMDCIGKTGEVILAENDNITVRFDGGSWSFKEMALAKVRQFKKGDLVQVKDNEHEVQELQNGHGEWNQKTRRTLGKKGVVKFVDKYDDVAVAFGGTEFKFNPECLEFSKGDPDDLSDEPIVKPRQPDITQVPSRPRTQPGAERDIERRLKEAAIAGDSTTVEGILQQHNSLVNAEAMDKPLIHVACEKGHSDVVRVLVNFKANVEVEDSGSSKCTPLLTAVINKQPEVVKVLLRARVRKNVCNANKQTAVHLATKNQDLEMLDVLKEGGFDINQQDALGDIPVADAIDTGNIQVIRKVLNWPSLNLDIENSLGFSPLHIAARKGNTEAVDLILKKCPDLLNGSKRDGYTALHLAACQNHADIVQLLLRKRIVNTEMRTVSEGWTPLHIACMHQSKETVEMLIVRDGKSLVQVDSEDNERNNSLHLCLRDERTTTENPQINEDQDTKYEIAKMLIDEGIQYNTKNSHGKTALDECVNETLQHRVRELVQGKDVRQKPRTVNPTPKVCLSCNEDPANYILNPCLCYICNECGAKKAKKCPNCSEAVLQRTKISVL